MPEKETLKRAQKDKREGKALTTQAGEFIREEIHHVREGKHGARSTKQAIAIGLSKARRAGVRLPPPEDAPKSVRRRAAGDLRRAKSGGRKTSRRRARATMRSNVTVGPPIDLLVYGQGELRVTRHRRLDADDADLKGIRAQWEQALRKAVFELPAIPFR